ncbi:MAG: hypothetical protein DWP98_04425 [Bacteroidetes bacterium]|nr:MAG: hypothetical protein DWP98_04425 [Bacteroidota bacterium]MBL1145819.1 hypothetical protein [Bacteroidota bacterium]NOG58613.1 hypothetical protein [Bacteroidota bacterium]
MKKINWFVFLFLLFLLSYFRETVFLGINEIIEGNFESHPYTFKPEILFQYTTAALSNFKYILTGFFSILFASTTLFSLRFAFHDKLAFKIGFLTYSIALASILLAAISSLLLFDFAQVYPFIRSIIGYIHSPLIYILISATVLVNEFYRKEN